MDDIDKYVYCLITHTFSNIRIFEKRKFHFFVSSMVFKSVIFYLTILLRLWFFRTRLNNRDLIKAGCSSVKEFSFWIWVILNGFVFDESYYELYQHVISNYHSGWTWYRNLEMGIWRAFRWCGRGDVSRVSRGSWILLGRVCCLGGLALLELLIDFVMLCICLEIRRLEELVNCWCSPYFHFRHSTKMSHCHLHFYWFSICISTNSTAISWACSSSWLSTPQNCWCAAHANLFLSFLIGSTFLDFFIGTFDHLFLSCSNPF